MPTIASDGEEAMIRVTDRIARAVSAHGSTLMRRAGSGGPQGMVG